MNADGSEVVRLTNNDVADIDPAYSPEGTKLAFSSSRASSAPALYTMNTDGTNVQRLLFLANSSFSASWSPDGANIAVMTTNATDNPATPVDESEDRDPAYSPDGTKIVFSSARSGDYEIYTMNAADGTGVTRLTNTPGLDLRCDWQTARPTLSGRVRIPPGTSQAAVCSGRVRLTLTKGRKTVAKSSAKVSKSCTYKRKVTIRTAKRTGSRGGRLKVGARYGGNSRLESSKKSISVRFF